MEGCGVGVHICRAARSGLVGRAVCSAHGAARTASDVQCTWRSSHCERCAVQRSSLWRWDAAAREGPCEGHKGLADETGERVRFCGALLLDAVGTCCAARVALLWCEPRFPDACAAGAEAMGAAREPGARALGRAGVVRPLSMRRCNGAPAMRGVMIVRWMQLRSLYPFRGISVFCQK